VPTGSGSARAKTPRRSGLISTPIGRPTEAGWCSARTSNIPHAERRLRLRAANHLAGRRRRRTRVVAAVEVAWRPEQTAPIARTNWESPGRFEETACFRWRSRSLGPRLLLLGLAACPKAEPVPRPRLPSHRIRGARQRPAYRGPTSHADRHAPQSPGDCFVRPRNSWTPVCDVATVSATGWVTAVAWELRDRRGERREDLGMFLVAVAKW